MHTYIHKYISVCNISTEIRHSCSVQVFQHNIIYYEHNICHIIMSKSIPRVCSCFLRQCANIQKPWW